MKLFFITISLLISILLTACGTSEDAVPAADSVEETVAAASPVPATATAVPTREPSADWQIVQKMQPENKARYAAFLNETSGFASCGEFSPPSITADGGQTWTQPPIGQFCPNSIEIINSQSAWFCNKFGVYFSRDGGNTMSQMYSPYRGCGMLSFVDDTHGWSAFEEDLTATSDGALRWLDVERPEDMGEISAIFLREPEVGYVLTKDGVIYSTDDGAESWSSLNLGIEDSGMNIVNMDGRPPTAVHFEDDQNGFVILNLTGDGAGIIIALHTTDGGQSWEQHQLPLNPGAVYLTRDGQYLTVAEHGAEGNITILKNLKAAVR